MFFSITKTEVCHLTDDNTLYSCNKNLENVFSNFKWDLNSVLEWFRINSLKVNPRKFKFMVLGTDKVNSYNLFIDGVKVFCSKEAKVTIDNQLNDFCKKASYKRHALRRLRPYLIVNKARLLANSFPNLNICR